MTVSTSSSASSRWVSPATSALPIAVSVIRSVPFTRSSRAFIAAVRSVRSCSLRVLTGVHASRVPGVRTLEYVNSLARLTIGAVTTGAAGIAYAAGYERRRWTLREATVPVLPEGSRPLKILHVSDLHLTPGQESKKRWVAELAALDPDVVVDTGDNLAHPRAVPGVLAALGPLLEKPGLFVFGSNDYFGPTPKNPARYLRSSDRRIHGEPLPWRDLRAAFVERGWQDATHQRLFLDVDGRRIGVVG